MIHQNSKKQQGSKIFKSVAVWLWHVFSSVRLAVILILILSGLGLLGALLIQVPSEMVQDSQLYSYWVNTVAKSKVGDWAGLLSLLHLFDVFRSPWFLTAGILLMLNILICSLKRWGSISLSLRGGTVKQKESFYTTGDTVTELSTLEVPIVESVRISEKVLRTQGYRIRSQNEKNNIYIAADKNRYYRLGTYFHHLSLILLVLAFITGSYFGFYDSRFTIPVGSDREIGHDTDLSLELTSFTVKYYDNGMPKDYRSQVVLYENGQVVKQALVRVNHPLIYKGTRFYQAYYGPAVKMQIHDEIGQEIFNGNIPLDSTFHVQDSLYYEGFLNLPEAESSIRLISPTVDDNSTIIPAGQLAVDLRQGNDQIDLRLVEMNTPRVVGNLEFTFLQESMYSGFQVRQDPTNTFIWIASTLFIIGICLVFYFPFRQVWILSQSQGQENSRLLIRMLAPRSYSSSSQLNAFLKQMEKELTIYKKGEGER